MYRPFQTVSDFVGQAEALRVRRYGVIEMAEGRLVGVHLRPFPKLISLPEVWWLGGWSHHRLQGDRCWLYYNQPFTSPDYLAMSYVVSGSRGSLASFHGALEVLDEIARIKESHAIVCDVTNSRISDRLLSRWGWDRHFPQSRRRHFIKRFYGDYPQATAARTRSRSCDSAAPSTERPHSVSVNPVFHPTGKASDASEHAAAC